MALVTRELKASYAFVERNFNLTKRYWGWEIAWLVYSVAGALAVSLIGVSEGDPRLLMVLVIGTIFWSYLSIVFEFIAEAVQWERWEGTLEYTFMAPVRRYAQLLGAAAYVTRTPAHVADRRRASTVSSSAWSENPATTSSIPTRLRIATPFQRPSPQCAASYPSVWKAMAGKSASASFVSWRHSTSGCAYCSHSSTRGRRALSEFTFQVAMRMEGVSVRAMTADLVIKGGRVLDGSGGPAIDADVAIDGGVISDIDRGLDGRRVLDAGGHVVTPGFIDIHTHYDAQVFWDPALTPSCWHGVTTVVSGNCGFSLAPCHPEHRDLMVRTLEHVEAMSPDALRAGVRWEFETFPEYLDAIERQGTVLNFGAYVGHTPVRLWVMGDDGYEREAKPDEIEAMAGVVAESVMAGALGFATSSAPTHQGADGRPVPSRLATVEEVTALAAAMASTGRGVFAALPSERIQLQDAYDIQAAIGRPMTWTALLTGFGDYHLKAVEKNDAARAAGQETWPQISVRPLVFQFDMREPFNLDTVPNFAELHGLGEHVRRERYADATWRAAAQDALDHGRIRPQWHKYEIAESDTRADLVGRRVGELAEEWVASPLDVMCEIALADELRTRFRGILANDDPEAIDDLLRRDGLVLGLSDAGAHGAQLCDACFSTELLGTFVRERGAIPLERAVHKLTGEVASAFRMDGRGYLRPGLAADVCVFDPDTVAPGPIRRVRDLPAGADRLLADSPEGIAHVVVNGTVIREDGAPLAEAVDARPGVVVRSVPGS
jgi:N-acyl-D-aspartate/D-glutamate deacylase